MSIQWAPVWGKRTYLMGVINVTPDSFSGDGLHHNSQAAASKAESMVSDGADLIDLGGESTRPGHQPVPLEEELARVIPALRQIATMGVRVPVSIDTSKAEVAAQALAEGAAVVNDVSGLRDPAMARVVGQANGWIVLVHNHRLPEGTDVVTETRAGLLDLINKALEGGVDKSKILIDPGLGFGKNWRANFEIIRRLAEFRELGKPLLIGPSRKGMIGRVLGSDPADRLEGSLALVSMCAAQRADVLRVHDVREMSRATRVIDALVRD